MTDQKQIRNLEMHEHKLALEAIYELLKEKKIITDQEFTEKISYLASKNTTS